MFASNFPVDGLKGSWDYLYSQFKAAVADLPARRAPQAVQRERRDVLSHFGLGLDLSPKFPPVLREPLG